jgi:hypothetical protein
MTTAETNGIYIWNQGRPVQNLFVCPVEHPNHRFTIAIFGPGGRQWPLPQTEYETLESAVSVGIDQAIRMLTCFSELTLAHKLKEAGLLNQQKLTAITQQAWTWCQMTG